MTGTSSLVAISFMLAAGTAYAGPIHDAAAAGDAHEVLSLVSEGTDVNEVDRLSGMPLHVAALKGKLEVAEALIDAGASVDEAAGILRATPLHMAAIGGGRDLAALLVAAGADLDARNATLNTPLMFAASEGNLAVAKLLLAAGADVNARNQGDDTAIHLAGAADHVNIVDLLLANGATPQLVEPVTGLLRDADPESGRQVFVQCKQCHTLAKGDPGNTGPVASAGPSLWGVLERPKGASPTFDRYSGAFGRLEGPWSYEDLNAFLAAPSDFAPGTNMGFLGLKDPAERADLIVYLRENGEAPPPLPE